MVPPRSFAPLGLAVVLAACAAGEERKGFEPTPAPPGETQTPPAEPSGEFETAPTPPAPETPEVHEVYGHSATTL